MLRGLDISDMLIIDRLELAFQPGLNVLTGETGAGKSIAIDALGLCLGDRADAEDVTQDAMMRLWKVAPDWRVGEAKVSTWLYHVTANLCTDRLRRKRGVGLDEVDEPLDPSPSVTNQLQTRERMDALQAGLQTLPARQRQAVILRHIEGLANPEIAEILEISTEAVESLTARGKRALAQALAPAREKLGYEDDGI